MRSHLLAAVIVAVAACAPAAAAQASSAAPADTCNHVTFPADLEAVRRAYVAAWQGTDAQAVARFFTDSARVRTDDESFTGRDAILAGWISDNIGKLSDMRMVAHVANHLIREEIDSGTITLRFHQAGGVVNDERGSYTHVWARQPDGGWLLSQVTLRGGGAGPVCSAP